MSAATYSRPFRSLAIFLVAWVLMRAVTIWSGEILKDDVRAAPSSAVAVASASPVIARLASDNTSALPQLDRAAKRVPNGLLPAKPFIAMRAVRPIAKSPIIAPAILMATHGDNPVESAISTIPSAASFERPALQTDNTRNRWSGSAWLLVRSDGPGALGTAGELGGSQAGVRVLYDLDGPVAATARISRALSRAQGGEASVGIAVRHRNIGLLLERRVALDRGGRNDFSATAYGGFSDVAVVRDVRLDGYAQAGIVGTDKFVDGAVRVERTVATMGQARVSAGAGIWGGAQPGVERVDVGPQIVARVPVEGRTIRVSAEWRERIAGDAAPSSGPSLTIGIDL